MLYIYTELPSQLENPCYVPMLARKRMSGRSGRSGRSGQSGLARRLGLPQSHVDFFCMAATLRLRTQREACRGLGPMEGLAKKLGAKPDLVKKLRTKKVCNVTWLKEMTLLGNVMAI